MKINANTSVARASLKRRQSIARASPEHRQSVAFVQIPFNCITFRDPAMHSHTARRHTQRTVHKYSVHRQHSPGRVPLCCPLANVRV